MRISVRVISLARSAHRREHMAAQLSGLNLAWSFFDACEALPVGLPYDRERARWVRGRELTAGELGCFASHVSLWKLLLDDPNADALCVLEDDLLVDCRFFNNLENFHANSAGMDYVRFYAKVPVPLSYIGTGYGRHIVRFRKQAFGTQGYLITRAGAKKFLRSIKRVVRPIDDEMDRFWDHGVPIYSVFPFPILEVDFGSTIEPNRRTLAELGGLDLTRRLAFRGMEKVRRIRSNLCLDIKKIADSRGS